MNQKIQKGKYRHYKGKEYEVLGLAHHSETMEPLVVYKALYDSDEFGPNAIWARPLLMFMEEVKIDNKKVPRFKYLG